MLVKMMTVFGMYDNYLLLVSLKIIELRWETRMLIATRVQDKYRRN